MLKNRAPPGSARTEYSLAFAPIPFLAFWDLGSLYGRRPALLILGYSLSLEVAPDFLTLHRGGALQSQHPRQGELRSQAVTPLTTQDAALTLVAGWRICWGIFGASKRYLRTFVRLKSHFVAPGASLLTLPRTARHRISSSTRMSSFHRPCKNTAAGEARPPTVHRHSVVGLCNRGVAVDGGYARTAIDVVQCDDDGDACPLPVPTFPSLVFRRHGFPIASYYIVPPRRVTSPSSLSRLEKRRNSTPSEFSQSPPGSTHLAHGVHRTSRLRDPNDVHWRVSVANPRSFASLKPRETFIFIWTLRAG